MKYRREIDGLRTVAVGSVVLFHAGMPGFAGGYVGVDVFFVISGFLITTILLGDLEAGRFSVLTFYERRARRILPALSLVVLCTALAGALLMSPHQIGELAESVAATALFAANVYFWRSTDYFGTAAEEKPLLHMWSLAVEEQFYILFPLLLLVLWRWRPNRLQLWFMALAALSLALAEAGWRLKPWANFYLPAGRAWELLAGAMIAARLRGAAPEPSAAGRVLAPLGLALVIASIALIGEGTPYPSLWTAIPVAGTALLIRYAGPQDLAGRLLGLRPMVFVGLLSYSIYLWHQPLLAFARIELIGPPPLPAALGLMALSVPLAWLSWRFVERPFRTSPARGGFSRPAIFAMSGAAIGGMTALGVAVALSPQTVERIYVAALDAEGRARLEAIETAISSRTEEVADRSECHIAVQYVDRAALDARLAPCVERYGKATLLLGDSHMGDLFGALSLADGAPPFMLRIGRGGCVPHRLLGRPPAHRCAYDEVRAFMERRPDVVGAVLYTELYWLLLPDPRRSGPEAIRGDLVDETLDWLASLKTEVPKVIVGPKDFPFVDTRLLDPGRDLRAQIERGATDLSPIVAAVGETWRRRAEARGFLYLDLNAAVGARYPGDAMIGDAPAFRDQLHWSAVMARRAGPLVAAALAREGVPGFR